MSSLVRLSRELWDLVSCGDASSVARIVDIPRQSERLGTVEYVLRDAIKKSSLGLFGGRLYYFGGRIYEPLSNDVFESSMMDLLFDYIGLPKVDYCAVYSMICRCRALARSKPLEVNNRLMVFDNGVLDTGSGVFSKSFDKKFVQMWSVGYSYNPDARIFLWKQFLEQVLPDVHLRDALQMFLGASFVERREAKIEKLLLLVGRGANGKGVINQTILGVLGDYVGTKSIGALCSRGIDGEESLALINGKKLNFATEMSVDDFKRRDARLKTIVSGERASARFRYERGFDAENIPLLMSSANRIPYFDASDDALIRRIYPIPFDVVVPEERRDPTLPQKMESEYPAILNWILDGRDKFVKNGYSLPPEVHLKRLMQDGHAERNTAVLFMEKNGYKAKIDGVELVPKNVIPQKELYRRYEQWCLNNGVMMQTRPAFVQALEEHGFVRKRYGTGMSFLLFGDITTRTLKDANLRRDNEQSNELPITWVDGKGYLRSQRLLALFVGLNIGTIRKMVNNRVLEPGMRTMGNKTYYDIEECVKILRDNKYLSSDKEKALRKDMKEKVTIMRQVFNSYMAKKGLPYRKQSSKVKPLEDWIRVVHDDTTIADVKRMAAEDGYDVEDLNLEPFTGRSFGRQIENGEIK